MNPSGKALLTGFVLTIAIVFTIVSVALLLAPDLP